MSDYNNFGIKGHGTSCHEKSRRKQQRLWFMHLPRLSFIFFCLFYVLHKVLHPCSLRSLRPATVGECSRKLLGIFSCEKPYVFVVPNISHAWLLVEIISFVLEYKHQLIFLLYGIFIRMKIFNNLNEVLWTFDAYIFHLDFMELIDYKNYLLNFLVIDN